VASAVRGSVTLRGLHESTQDELDRATHDNDPSGCPGPDAADLVDRDVSQVSGRCVGRRESGAGAEDSRGDLVEQFGSAALLDARRALDRQIGCLRPAAVGGHEYESLPRKGETMTPAAMATYAFDQIDQARAELNAVSK
jgi:hypothetical protein